jgi:hypothetical protein
LGALAGADEFLPWVRDNLTFKLRLSGLLSTADGVRRVTILLDTGATHCFICARLVAVLGLPLSGQQGLLSVATAAAGGAQGLGAPVFRGSSTLAWVTCSAKRCRSRRWTWTWGTT